MIKIKLLPLDGIIVQHFGLIKLGQLKSEIERIIGLPTKTQEVSIDNTSVIQAVYYEYEFRLDYAKDASLEFIEFMCGPFPEKTELNLFGFNPFQVNADYLIENLTFNNSGIVDNSEEPYSYTFQNISVGIWRQSNLSDILEWIEEKKILGEYESDANWISEELEKSKHFWTIGIGKKDYYQRV